jgi:hypothetical protein
MAPPPPLTPDDKTFEYTVNGSPCVLTDNKKICYEVRQAKLKLSILNYKMCFYNHMAEYIANIANDTDIVYEAYKELEQALRSCAYHKDSNFRHGEGYSIVMDEIATYRKVTIMHMLLLIPIEKLDDYLYLRLVTLYQSKKYDFATTCTPMLIKKGMKMPDWYTK